MYLLQGMESLRNSGTLPRVQLYGHGRVTKFRGGIPRLSLFGVSPIFFGMDFNHLLEREGDAEQLAFKGWVEQVYNIVWESQYRSLFDDVSDGGDTIRSQTDILGDLRHIRNDLIHSGIATEEETGRCKVLKWFEPSQPLILGTRHVFDFMNQMGWMVSSPLASKDHKLFNWDVSVVNDKRRRSDQTRPKVVSVRTVIDRDPKAGTVKYMISVVFEDGFFTQKWVDMSTISSPDASEQEKSDIFNSATIDEDGNLQFSTMTVPGSELYDGRLGAERTRGKSMPEPWLKFKRG